MVGVPSSKGCLLCVRRRVRCDQVQPHCGNCLRHRASCPGYDRSLKFVTGKHKVKARRSRLAGESSSTASSSPRTDSSDIHVETPALTIASPTATHAAAAATWWGTHVSIPWNPKTHQAQFICVMLESLDSTVTRNEVGFLNGIQVYLGRRVALDSAVSSLVLHLIGKSHGDSRLIGESRSLYGQSLTALQAALNHPVEWDTSETLCATTILCLFELFAGTKDGASWMQHATGISSLIQRRGPDVYQNEWDRSILNSLRPILIMHAMFSGQDCFLAERQWHKLLSSSICTPSTDAGIVEKRALADRYFLHLARIPGILRHAYPLREARQHSMEIDNHRVTRLMQRTVEIRNDLLTWAEELDVLIPPPVEVPSQDPSSPFPSVFQYENVWHGALYIGYWATMLILQECLIHCHYEGDIAPKNSELASNIYRSLETVGKGIMGPYRIGYSMRIAYEFADLPTQLWMKTLLQRHECTYAGLQAESFPPPSEKGGMDH